MKKINVNIQDGYPLYVGCDVINQLPQLLSRHNISDNTKLVCITDRNVATLYIDKIKKALSSYNNSLNVITIPAGESTKNLRTIENVTEGCLKYELDRKGVILALGGGVVGDIAGFVAATYMRGIRYVHLPTTIIAHDSSIGGKVGVNHTLGKNIIGAFHQPQFVLFDVMFLETLPFIERISGYAEVIKHALIQDARFVNWLLENEDSLISLQLGKVAEAIFHSCSIKAKVVSQDEKEEGLRMILNYGHTIGHALEAISKYNKYKHGEAVAIGMCGAAHLGELFYGNNIAKDTTQLLSAYQLPTQFEGQFSNRYLLTLMKNDKKRKNEKHTFVLSPEIGKAKITDIGDKDVEEALQKIRKK